MKAEKYFGDNFFWVLVGLPEPDSISSIEYYIIPSSEMAKNVMEGAQAWLGALGKKGQMHNDSGIRTVSIPTYKDFLGWDIGEFHDRWDLIEERLKG